MEPSLRGWENPVITGIEARARRAAMEPSLRGWENIVISASRSWPT